VKKRLRETLTITAITLAFIVLAVLAFWLWVIAINWADTLM